jgi:hypothetical protein
LNDPSFPTAALADPGYAFVGGDAMRPLVAACGSLADWAAFAASWQRLEVDAYMADQGRYRRRRHACFRLAADGRAERLPHQPHWQAVAYNPLHGGIERWFEPVEDAVAAGESLAAILACTARGFGALAPDVPAWFCEVHQFRIEALPDVPGKPTPEGVHRDGVDWVLVLMVERHNIASGTTTVHAPDGRELGAFTLTDPFDAALVDDHRVFHGVTPVEPLDPARPAWRDVLVVTLRQRPPRPTSA